MRDTIRSLASVSAICWAFCFFGCGVEQTSVASAGTPGDPEVSSAAQTPQPSSGLHEYHVPESTVGAPDEDRGSDSKQTPVEPLNAPGGGGTSCSCGCDPGVGCSLGGCSNRDLGACAVCWLGCCQASGC